MRKFSALKTAMTKRAQTQPITGPAQTVESGPVPSTEERVLIRYQIIIADADPMSRTLLEAILRAQRSYDARTATDAAGVEALLQAGGVDLLLIDGALPDGFALCRRLKDDRRAQRIPIILLASHASAAERGRGLSAGADDVVGKPFHRTELLLRMRALLRIKSLQDQLEEVEQTMFALSHLIEMRDQYTQTHTERVAAHVEMLGRAIGLNEEDLLLLRRAAFLHDIGKAGLPDLLLNKPGSWTAAERRLMRHRSLLHTQKVAPFLSTPRLLPILRHSHEHFDGSGYPDHLAGEQIPLGARILAIADAFDALITERPYRPAVAPSDARRLMLSGAGAQWDGALVQIFARCLESAERESARTLAA